MTIDADVAAVKEFIYYLERQKKANRAGGFECSVAIPVCLAEHLTTLLLLRLYDSA